MKNKKNPPSAPSGKLPITAVIEMNVIADIVKSVDASAAKAMSGTLGAAGSPGVMGSTGVVPLSKLPNLHGWNFSQMPVKLPRLRMRVIRGNAVPLTLARKAVSWLDSKIGSQGSVEIAADAYAQPITHKTTMVDPRSRGISAMNDVRSTILCTVEGVDAGVEVLGDICLVRLVGAIIVLRVMAGKARETGNCFDMVLNAGTGIFVANGAPGLWTAGDSAVDLVSIVLAEGRTARYTGKEGFGYAN